MGRGDRWEPSAGQARCRKRRCGNQSAPDAVNRPERPPRGCGAPLAALGPPPRPLLSGSPAPGGLSPTSATAGPSAPRLPRPRLPPARPRARSPVHAAGHRPPPPGWGCTNEGRRRRRRSGGSASDTDRTAHAGAARARAPCWTGGVRARLNVFSQRQVRDPPYNSTQSWAALFIAKETANRSNKAACFTCKTDKNVNILL